MTKADQIRLTTWRFNVLQQAAAHPRSVARTCRHFGISRKLFYKWKRRFDEHGPVGLCDRSRVPHRSPRATQPKVVSKMLYLRQHYHLRSWQDCGLPEALSWRVSGHVVRAPHSG